MNINQCAAGALHFFEDVVCGGRPNEGFRILVVMIDVVVDGVHEFDDVAKDTSGGDG